MLGLPGDAGKFRQRSKVLDGSRLSIVYLTDQALAGSVIIAIGHSAPANIHIILHRERRLDSG